MPLPSTGDPPSPGIEPASLPSPALAGGFFTTASPGKPTGLWREADQGRSHGTLLEELFGGFTLNEKGMRCWVLPFFFPLSFLFFVYFPSIFIEM